MYILLYIHNAIYPMYLDNDLFRRKLGNGKECFHFPFRGKFRFPISLSHFPLTLCTDVETVAVLS